MSTFECNACKYITNEKKEYDCHLDNCIQRYKCLLLKKDNELKLKSADNANQENKIKLLEKSVIDISNNIKTTSIQLIRKKEKIPSALRRKVWYTYIGKISESLCPICETTVISEDSFHCGHVLAENNGGTLDIKNLRSICQYCNESMGTIHMKEFAERYFPNSKILESLIDYDSNEKYDSKKETIIKYIDEPINVNTSYELKMPYIHIGTHIVHVIVDELNNIWFGARGIAASLGYRDPHNSINRLIDKKYKKCFTELKPFANVIVKHAQTIYINEDGLNVLFESSRFSDELIKEIMKKMILSIKKIKFIELKELFEKQIKSIKNNLSNNVQTTGVVYAIKLNTNEYKIKKSKSINKKRECIISIDTLYPSQLESIIKVSLDSYKNGKLYCCNVDVLKRIFKDSNKYLVKTKMYDNQEACKLKQLKKNIKMIDDMFIVNSQDINELYRLLVDRSTNP